MKHSLSEIAFHIAATCLSPQDISLKGMYVHILYNVYNVYCTLHGNWIS